MRLFKKLRRKLNYLSEKQIEEIYHAYLTAAMAHEGQKRFTGDPYITHPVSVACILADIKMDKQSIMAALLHDVIEDTEIDKATLAEEFGQQVAELVDGVSKLTQIEFRSRAEAQAENFRKMVLAMAKDIRVIIVKLADRLHNMRTLEPLRATKRRRIAQETLDIFAPIANRLGMHSFYVELEELGFEALYPHRHAVLKEAVRKARGNRKEILSVIFESLKNEIGIHHLPYCEVIGREKHLYSIYKKMRNKHLSFNEIMDVYAFRIIVDSIDNSYRVLGVVHGLYKPLTERFKDYIAIPKANYYQSLHTTLFGPYGVPIEIQIRTQEMDEMANFGIAAHWLYKTGEKYFSNTQARAQKWVKNLLEMQQSTGSSLEFIENVKVDLFPDEVYVFTPHGDIMELPNGSTPVDYAYTVHTDIGNSCVAAKIDRQLAPLSTLLSNGQTVEIITSHNARPNPAWIDFVVTGKARSSIRHFLKIQQRVESMALGKQLLNKALAGMSLSIKKIPNEIWMTFLNETALTSVDDLLEELGLGNRVPLLVAHRLAGSISNHTEGSTFTEALPAKPLFIKGTEGMVMNFATCCLPIPGDPIVGLFQAGKGIIVHTEQCKRIANLRSQPEKCMLVRWSAEIKSEFPVIVEVEVHNKRGSLAAMAMSISDAEANIDDIRITERDGHHYLVTFKLMVQNRVHLAHVIRLLRKVKQVVHIRRGKSP
ncbi:MAG: bifunctional GTP diphosphokinase/guanosine-3',5'-bis pyrophosphate 3'-pyrophosphohydrolase [Gammaproteobacteria bacterium]|nr:bifunctional GTP diphosphokinase/guanosine-3',5'-bis pyrophosphate 3'-pyrophosphohydrolase [Gammaproteobacteria bacterium]